MPKYDDLSRSLVAFDQNSTLVAAIEMGSKGWLVGALVPGLERDPRKKLSPDKQALLKLLHRWCAEAARKGRAIKRICVAYEAGRDGVWLARWLREQGIEAYGAPRPEYRWTSSRQHFQDTMHEVLGYMLWKLRIDRH